jgi:hypothetical protein
MSAHEIALAGLAVLLVLAVLLASAWGSRNHDTE